MDKEEKEVKKKTSSTKTKSTAKKATTKKTTAKKTTTKKETTKKASTSKAATTKSTATKASTAKKTTTKKAPAKKTTTTKKTSTTKKTVANKKPEVVKEAIVEKEVKEEKIPVVEKKVEVPKEVVKKIERAAVPRKVLRRNYNNYLYSLVALIILFIILFIFFLFRSMGSNYSGVTYSEYTYNDYSVCTNDFGNCTGKDKEYNAYTTNYIHTTLEYEAIYTEKVPVKFNYYVMGHVKMYDLNDNTKVVKTVDDYLVTRNKLKTKNSVVNFSTDLDVDFIKYRDIVDEYIRENGLVNADLEVALYIEDGDDIKKVSYITVPLTDAEYTIKSSNLDLQNQEYKVTPKVQDGLYLAISLISLVMSVLLFMYFIGFISNVNRRK